MIIGFERTKFFKYYFEYSFNNDILDFCRATRESYGWQNFNWNEGRWRFNDSGIIFLIKMRFPLIEINKEVIKDVEEEQKLLEENKKILEEAERIKSTDESSLGDIEGIKGNLREYQKIGVEFFMNNKGRGLLADDMGSGKTLQSLAYLTQVGHKRSLVVCPASVKFSWENEVGKWTKLKSYVVESKTDFREIPSNVNVIIINYDILKKHINSLMLTKWDCMICDEAHLCKNRESIRSKAIKMISKDIPSILMLTGTPLLSRPIELFHLLHVLDPKTWTDYYDFARRYCLGHRGRYGYEAKGATNLDELRQKISRYFLRRTKDQILSELPPMNKIPFPVELTGKSKENYNKVSKEFVKYLRENKGKKDKDILRSLNAEKLVKINYLREINCMGKLDAVRELIDSILDSGEKTLVFCSFNEPLKILRDEYPNSVLMLGETDVNERGGMVKKFQEDPDCKVFFGGIRSAGVGITLTAASTVIFIDHSWNPADMEQAAARVHRLGQKAESVNIYQVISKGTIDEFMMKLIDRKQKIFDVVIDSEKKEREEAGSVDELIKMIEESS